MRPTTLWRGGLRNGAFLWALYEVGLALLCSMRVELVPGEVIHRPWPWQAKRVELGSVSSAWLAVDPGVNLALAQGPRDEDAVVVNLRPFSEASAAAILAHIRAFNATIPIDVTGVSLKPVDDDTIARESLLAGRIFRGVLVTAAVIALAAAVRWAMRL